MAELSEQEVFRRQNLQALKDMGINPYPAQEYPVNAYSTDIVAEFKDEDETQREVCIAGRLAARLAVGANERCHQAARDAMNGSTPVGNCLYFRTVIPEIKGQIIGDHVFY